jgi:hypothetical protein
MSEVRCNICKRELDVDSDPFSTDCGGDCLACMADADDPIPKAFKEGFLAAIEFIRDKEDRYGIGSMCSQWTAGEVADDILERVKLK